ncbi:MAG: hypothetical protein ACKV1O_14195, partial [Saprospiraceae bacterium]
MNEQNFDNQIRDSLGDYHSKLDTGALWKELEPQIAADKKRRRGIFWWWSGAGVLLALGVWAWVALQNPQPISAASEMGAENQAANLSSETKTSGAETKPASEGKTAKTSPFGQTGEATKGAVAVNPTQAPVVETPAQPVSKVSKLPKSVSKPAGKRNLPQAAAFGKSTPPASDQAPMAANASAPASPTAGTANPQPDVKTAQEAAMVTKEEKNPADQEGVLQTTGAIAGQVIAPLSPLAWLELKSLLNMDQMPPVLPVGTTKPRKKAAKTDLLIRPNFEIGYALKTLEDFAPDSLTNYHLPVRRESEEALEYLHGNLLLGARHHSGWYALTGLGYTSITERFSFNAERTERDSVGGITEIYINAEGDSTFTEGMVERIRYISYRKRTYSSYTLLDVPLIVGYEWEKRRWSFGAEAGIFLNISLKATGDALDVENNFTRLEETDWFKPSIGLSYYGSLRIGYAINDKTR